MTNIFHLYVGLDFYSDRGLFLALTDASHDINPRVHGGTSVSPAELRGTCSGSLE